MTFKNFIAYAFGGGWRIYNRKYKAQIEVDAGYYQGRLWKIVSCNGIYPLVYIEGSEDVYDPMGSGSPAHGDITFRGPRFDLGMPMALGYDFCHSGDYLSMSVRNAANPKLMRILANGRLWSLHAIRKNIKETIRWLNSLPKDAK